MPKKYMIELINGLNLMLQEMEAIMPGITARTSRSVAIGENGEIVNAQSHSQGRFSYSESSSGTDMALDFWTERSFAS